MINNTKKTIYRLLNNDFVFNVMAKEGTKDILKTFKNKDVYNNKYITIGDL